MCNSCNTKCTTKVIQMVPTKYDYKEVEMSCGSTSIHGTELRCEKCSNVKPWYICKHGRDVSEYDCGACELD
jgi:hypothetical protein